MPEDLVEKSVAVQLTSDIPLTVRDDQGVVIGSARLDGFVGVTIVINKHHPAALNLTTENGLAKLKLTASIEDNIVDGLLVVGG